MRIFFSRRLHIHRVVGRSKMDAKSIRERCLSYIDEWDSNPEYAILLTGAWGCGKNYFVQNLLKEQNKETPKLGKC